MKITPKRLKEIIAEEVSRFVKESITEEPREAEAEEMNESVNTVQRELKKFLLLGKKYYFTEKRNRT